jgi:Iap family predicted aminopeptidase
MSSLTAKDGASFMWQGIPAVTILGLNVKHHDPTYHTRIDLPEYVEEEAMQATRQFWANLYRIGIVPVKKKAIPRGDQTETLLSRFCQLLIS